jgi:hypothetical protein
MTKGLTIGPTIIGGEIEPDDYHVKEDGYGCGRIRLATGTNARQSWQWHINPPVPVRGQTTGQADSKEAAMEQFKAAWAAIRRTLTDHDIAHWHGHEDSVRRRFGK